MWIFLQQNESIKTCQPNESNKKQTKTKNMNKYESHYLPCNDEQILKSYYAVKWKLKINVEVVHA